MFPLRRLDFGANFSALAETFQMYLGDRRNDSISFGGKIYITEFCTKIVDKLLPKLSKFCSLYIETKSMKTSRYTQRNVG